jgi:hypothetical protein
MMFLYWAIAFAVWIFFTYWNLRINANESLLVRISICPARSFGTLGAVVWPLGLAIGVPMILFYRHRGH